MQTRSYIIWFVAVIGGAAGACFDPITLPICTKVADCPGGFSACEDGYCLRPAAGCPAGTETRADGCCQVDDRDNASDPDCTAWTRSLEASLGFAGPVIDATEGGAYVSTLVEGPGDRPVVRLVRVANDGQVAWTRDVGTGIAGRLGSPAVSDGWVWAPFDLGLRALTGSGQEVDLVAGTPRVGHLAVGPRGLLAWWREGEDALVVRLPGEAAQVRWEPVVEDQESARAVHGPVLDAAGTLVVAARGAQIAALSAKGQVAPVTEVLESDARDLIVLNDRVFVVTDDALLAFTWLNARLIPSWSVDLPSPPAGELLAPSSGLLIVPLAEGRLGRVTDEGNVGRLVVGEAPLANASGRFAVLGTDGLVAGDASGLATFRWQASGGDLVVSSAWSYALSNGVGGDLAVDGAGRVHVMDAAGVLYRIVSGAEGAQAGSWPGARGGMGANGSAEAARTHAVTED